MNPTPEQLNRAAESLPAAPAREHWTFEQIYTQSQCGTLEAALQLLFDTYLELDKRYPERSETSLDDFGRRASDRAPRQIGDLALMPNEGTAYFLSDLEGSFSAFRRACRQHRIIERLTASDPADPVYLCVLGDTVDRGRQASQILEFLLHLKVRCGLFDQVLLLPGNHELTSYLQREKNGFFDEIDSYCPGYRTSDDCQSPIIQKMFSAKYGMPWEKISYITGDPELFFNAGRDVLWEVYNGVFTCLPKYIGCEGVFFASHAGFPARGRLAELYLSEEAQTRPVDRVEFLYELAFPEEQLREKIYDDATWSDINPSFSLFGENRGRAAKDANGQPMLPAAGSGIGLVAIDRFLSAGNWPLWIRGHQGIPPVHEKISREQDGVWSAAGRVFTLQSTFTNFANVPAEGACIELNLADPDQLKIHTI